MDAAADRLRQHVMTRLKTRFVGRDDVVDLIALAVVAGEHLFLFGPPGTAKSAVVRQFALAVHGNLCGVGMGADVRFIAILPFRGRRKVDSNHAANNHICTTTYSTSDRGVFTYVVMRVHDLESGYSEPARSMVRMKGRRTRQAARQPAAVVVAEAVPVLATPVATQQLAAMA